MRFVGSNPAPETGGLDELPGRSNYFIGDDREKWRTDVPNYARVEYRDLYPGVNLVLYGNQRQLEHDWVVSPGADPKAIRFTFDGVRGVRINEDGDLLLSTQYGQIRQGKPFAYQEVAGVRQTVAATYVRRGSKQFAFALAPYDRSMPLIIDPVLSYSDLIGGGGDYGTAIAVDTSGSAYVAGATFSSNFPTVNPLQGTNPQPNTGRAVGFLLKLNPQGSALVYSTYFGPGGPVNAVAVDANGNALVAVFAGPGFPLMNPAQATYGGNGDGFLAKVSPAGSSLVFATYLGGAQRDLINGIAVDSNSNVYVTGGTASADFPTTSGALQRSLPAGCTTCGDAFVTKFNPAGSVLYSTLLGGTNALGVGIAVDSGGAAYIVGDSRTPFPATPGAFQAQPPTCTVEPCGRCFAAKLNSVGSGLGYATFLDGSKQDVCNSIAVDSAGSAYATGYTSSSDFPTTAGALQRAISGLAAFITKLNATGTGLVYSSYLGGGGGDNTNGDNTNFGFGIAVDSVGNAYVTGSTSTKNFPLVKPVQLMNGGCRYPGSGNALNGCGDAFIAKINPTGSALLYSTYFGGSGNDQGNGIAVDSAGNAYVTGLWDSADSVYPAVGSLQSNILRGAFILKITDTVTTVVPAAVTNGASFVTGYTPGSIVTVFGTGLTNVNGVVTASSLPLPTQLSGTSLTVNGIPAPLFAVANVSGQQQINFQAPYEVTASLARVVVTNNGSNSDPVFVRVDPFQPGIFTTDGATGAVLHAADYQLVTPANPAKKGEVILIYATGLGPVNPITGTGKPAPASPLSQTVSTPDVRVPRVNQTTVDPLPILFSGLAPGFVGLYQVNVRVPDNAVSGDVDLLFIINGLASNTVKLSVQ